MYLFWLYVDIIYFVNDASCCFIFLNNKTHSSVNKKNPLLYTIFFIHSLLKVFNEELIYLLYNTKYNIYNWWQFDKQNDQKSQYWHYYIHCYDRWLKIGVDCNLLNVVKVILITFMYNLPNIWGNFYICISVQLLLLNMWREMHENILVANVNKIKVMEFRNI